MISHIAPTDNVGWALVQLQLFQM